MGLEAGNTFIENRVHLVNPNPGTIYVMVRGGEQVQVPGLVPFHLDEPKARQMLDKALKSWNAQNEQQRNEKLEYNKHIGSNDPSMKDRAFKFGEVTDKVFISKTQPPKRPFLVDLATEKGKEYYKDGMAEAKEEKIQVPKTTGPIQLPEDNLPLISAKDMRKPAERWDTPMLRKYVSGNGGMVGNADPADRLLKKALLLFEAMKKRYEDDGFVVNGID